MKNIKSQKIEETDNDDFEEFEKIECFGGMNAFYQEMGEEK